MTDHDHRQNIIEAYDSHTEYLRDANDPLDFLAEDVLEVNVWANADRRYNASRVEFTLTLGGPTVLVEVDEHDRVTYHHSWGMMHGKDCHEYHPNATHAEPWVELADMVRDMHEVT